MLKYCLSHFNSMPRRIHADFVKSLSQNDLKMAKMMVFVPASAFLSIRFCQCLSLNGQSVTTSAAFGVAQSKTASIVGEGRC